MTKALTIITTSFPISNDGSEAAGAFVADLVKEIAKSIPVRVVAPGPRNSQENWHKNIELFRYASPDKPLSTLKLWHPGDVFKIISVLRNGKKATLSATENESQHILALWALPSGEWARTVARKSGIGYSIWALGSDIWSLGKIPLIRNRLQKILEDATYCWADGIKLSNDAEKIARRRVDFLPSTRNITRTKTTPLRGHPPYRLLFIGRWHYNKGADILVSSLKLLKNEDWKHIERITIAGGGPLEPIISDAVNYLKKLGRPVFLRGYLNGDEAQSAMLDADYLMIPSRIESIPVIFSDAMKLSLPVIAMPVGDLPQLVTHKAGILANRVDAEAFAAAIRMSFGADRARMSPKTCSEPFDLKSIAEKIVKNCNFNQP